MRNELARSRNLRPRSHGRYGHLDPVLLVDTMSDEPEVSPEVRARQMQCTHSFIKGLADSAPRCPRCGLSQADQELLQAAMWSRAIMGGFVP